jgi:hypothetical protein
MGKFFLFFIGIILILIFSGIAFLGFLRRIVFSFIPASKKPRKANDSIIYDDGKTTVFTSKINDRTKRGI